MAERLIPTSIQHVGDQLAIAWSDELETFLALEKLRRACPCASCGGEPDVLGNIYSPKVTYTSQSFVLRNYHIVGGYALQPTWGDGHGTGIYTFPYLRRLGAEPEQ